VAVVLAPSVAVMMTVWGVVTEPAVAVNVAEPFVAGTVTEAGTDRTLASADVSVTRLPPVGAARLSVTVHAVAAPGARLTGAHASDDTVGLGVTVTVAVVLPPSVAVNETV